jgi:hypothetical protein
MPAKPLFLDAGIPVHDDSNWRDAVAHLEAVAKPNDPATEWSKTGFIPRDYADKPLGSLTATTSLPQWALDQYPKETWKERIQELAAKKMRIQDILEIACNRASNPFICNNQNPTNYCWCYATIHAIMIERELAGEPFFRLSPYSVACIVKNFSNEGGWGGEANAQAVKGGVCTDEFWPMEKPGMSSSERASANMNAIRNGRQYLQSSRPNAALHEVTEFWELKPRNWAEKMAVLLIPLPVASGYNWMGHERCSIDACLMSNGDTGCVDLDSYTSDGKLDLKILASSRGAPDDAVVPRVITPSDA